MHAFTGQEEGDLTFLKGDLIAIIDKLSSKNNNKESGWAKGRLKNGQIGIFPMNFVEIIQK